MTIVRTLTVVKTDIRGFTARSGEMSAAELDEFLRKHRAAVGETIRSHDGRIFKELGDSFLCTFESATQALRASQALQREFASVESPGLNANRVEVRISVTAGDVLLQLEDVFGEPVNRAARLEAVTPPGEVYFDEAVYHNMNRSEVASEPVGRFDFKGIAGPTHVHRVTFRHELREILAAPLFTDIVDFTQFTNTAPLAEVEDLMQFWEEAHKSAVASSGGVLRMILGDAMMLTFSSVAEAIAGWVALCGKVDEFNSGRSGRFLLGFSAGVDLGQVRIFRASMFGEATNRAARLSGYRARAGSLTLREAVLAEVPKETLASLGVEIHTATTEGVPERLTELGPLVALTRRRG